MNCYTKKLCCILPALALALTLAACGGGNSAGTDGGGTGSAAPDAPAITLSPKLEDAQARILNAEDHYCAIAVFNCPPMTSDISVTDADGDTVMFSSQYLGMTRDRGVWLLDCPFSDAVDVDRKYSVAITAYVGNDEETRTITDIGQITPEEREAIGLVAVDGLPAFVPPCDVYSDYQSFGFNALVYIFSGTGVGDLDDANGRFRFYAKDGTPLEEVFPDNAFSIDVRTPYVNALFDAPSAEASEALAEQLRSCEPYMTYTGPGGDTWSVPMIPAAE